MLPGFTGIGTALRQLSDDEPFVVRRPAEGTYDEHGVWQEQPATEFEARGSIQTATDEDLQKVEEGRRLRGGIRIYTASELLTASVTDQRQPDVVLWDAAEWQVERIDDWHDAGDYYKVIATRKGQ